MSTVLRLTDAGKEFPRAGGTVREVEGVSLTLEQGETLGVVGESGSGKSTLGRMALGLLRPDRGSVELLGQDLSTLDAKRLRSLRSRTQCVFQEPLESLDPSMRVGQIVAEPLVVHERSLSGAQRRDRVARVLEEVGLSADFAERRPRELSGGQQQRVGIARAVITRPEFLVLDEPTSSLDLSVRAGVLQLLRRLHADMGLAYLAISHDLGSVRYVCDRVAVMYRGRIVESGDAEAVLTRPLHPYTRALVSASLTVDPARRPQPAPLGPAVGAPPAHGCPLVGRCPISIDACSRQEVPLTEHTPGHAVACIRAGER